jgi:hypothetical protein
VLPLHSRMKRVFRWRQRAAGSGGAIGRDSLDPSLAGALSSTQTFSMGIKPLHGPADAIVECVHSSSFILLYGWLTSSA